MGYIDEKDEADELLEEEQNEITQEDAWTVISAFFDSKGLVRQQLDSFREFLENSLQEVVSENGAVTLKPEAQHHPGDQDMLEEKEYRIVFRQIYLSKPSFNEADGETTVLFPREARLRNLTYCSPIFVDVRKVEVTTLPDGNMQVGKGS